MRVLVVENNSEGQASLARKLESIDLVDKDTLDLSISLASEQNFLERVREFDVIMLGPSLAEQSPLLASNIKRVSLNSEVLILVPEYDYNKGAFRAALSRGARKVLSVNAPIIDIVQEFMCIYEEFRASGKVRSGKVIAVIQAKGGIGATSTCAALAEVCSVFGQRTMLWDLDIETRDLCRALAVEGDQPSIVRGWIDGSRHISRESLRSALMRVSPSVSILPPPDQMGASVDLVGRVDSIELVQSIINLSRVTHDNIIIDLGGRVGPAAGAILRHADSVVVMLDDSILGLSAARFFLSTLRSVVKSLDAVSFLCSGTSIPKAQLAEHIEKEVRFGSNAWKLPVIPFDSAAARWPGSGSTLYSLGKRSTRKAFEGLASELNLIKLEAPKPLLLLPFLRQKAQVPTNGMDSNGTALNEASLQPAESQLDPMKTLWHKVANSF